MPLESSLTASFLGVKYVSTFIFGATSANSFINNGSNLYSEVSPIETLKVTSAVKGSNFSDSDIVFCIRDRALLTSLIM